MIDRQVEDIQRLKEKLRRQECTAEETPFGSSTPSSKQLLKASSKAEARLKRGGAVPGHEGHGRGSASEEDADGVEVLDAPDVCPDCGCATEDWGTQERTVVDCEPVRSKTWLLRIHARRCPCCGKTVRPRPKGVQRIQALFRENANRLYRWATSCDIPADNNHAERGLRPIVIARKVCFGSQSPKGLETRQRPMTVFNTVTKRTDDALAPQRALTPE